MTDKGVLDIAPASPRRCPICGRPTKAETRPFCSVRCADIDLHRWLSDSYRIPGTDAGGDEGDAQP